MSTPTPPPTVADRALAGLGEGLSSLAGPLWRPLVTALVRPLQDDENLGPAPGEQVDLAHPTALYDVERTPHPGWLAQLFGVTLPRGATTEQIRDLVRSRTAARRGTPAAVIAAAQSVLTGTRKVKLVERDGSPWRLRVIVYASQTPDADAVRRAVDTERPAGIVVDLQVSPGQDWGDVADAGLTFGDLEAMTVQQLADGVPA